MSRVSNIWGILRFTVRHESSRNTYHHGAGALGLEYLQEIARIGTKNALKSEVHGKQKRDWIESELYSMQ